MTATPSVFVFDFDSTLVSVESFDRLLAIALDGRQDAAAVLAEIEAITAQGMNGEIDLSESLSRRLQAARITQAHIERTIELLLKSVTPGMPGIVSHLTRAGQQVRIMSGGFTEMIAPVAEVLGLAPEHIYANTFTKRTGVVTGIDFDNPLSRSSGKAETITRLKADHAGSVICIGDGISDAIPYLNGVADDFWGFFQHHDRPKVRAKATRSFDSAAALAAHLHRLHPLD